jgi:hypothetical protein
MVARIAAHRATAMTDVAFGRVRKIAQTGYLTG